MAYTPKTDWGYLDTPEATDANRWEQGIADATTAAENLEQEIDGGTL